MSRHARVISRTVEEHALVERCDSCGVDGEIEAEGYWQNGVPRGWYILLTPQARRVAGEIPGTATVPLSFCSTLCLARYTARLGA